MVLGVTVVIYLLVKTIKLIHIYSRDDGVLKYPQNDINSFLTKHYVKALCLCRVTVRGGQTPHVSP